MDSSRLPRTTSSVPPLTEPADTAADSQPSTIDHVPSFVPEVLASAVNPSRVAQEPAELHPGMRVGVGDRFEIVEPIYNVPGKTAVYLARDLRAGRREVAVKVVYADGPDFPLENLLEEAEKTARLDQRFAPVIYEWDLDPQCRFAWLAMEYIRGETLARHLHRLAPLTWEQARAVCRDILAGLADGLRRGMVHRDLKPGNVMWDEASRTWKVVDWGLGMAFSLATGRTEGPNISGTPRYIAPESWARAEYSPQSDFYSLGVLLVEMLTGENPLADVETSRLMEVQREAHLADFPDLPESAQPIIARATDPNPRQRYASAEDFLADLEGRKPRRRLGRRTWLKLAAAGGVAAALALGFFLLRPEPPRAPYRGIFTLWLAGRGPERFAEARPVGGPDTLPLRGGDRIVLEARLEQGGPGYIYVIWIDSDGKHRRIYPDGWRAGELPVGERRQADLRWPTGGGAAQLRPSSAGLESVLLLVRDRPLGPKENAEIDRLLDGLRWRQPPLWKGKEIAITWEDGLRARGPLDRGAPDQDSIRVDDDPLSQTEKLLLSLKERGLVSYSRALCYSFADR